MRSRTGIRFAASRRVIVAVLLASSSIVVSAQDIHHYVFFNRDRERITEPSFLTNATVEGAQLKYTWKELEPLPGAYNLDIIESDLRYLHGHGKKLFIQVQDVSFDTTRINIPPYLLTSPEYGGGVAVQWYTEDDGTVVVDGVLSRRWDPAVQKRLHLLLDTLGKVFDGRIEGMNLSETAIGFGSDPALWPPGFTFESYSASVIRTMDHLRRAFPHSVAMIYANFMPGEGLPENDKGYLRGIYDHAVEIGAAVGGPDLLPFRDGQLRHSYPLIRQRAGKIPAGLAVQWGNMNSIDPETGERVTVSRMIRFAKEYLHLEYIFWGTQEPYYSRDILPTLERL